VGVDLSGNGEYFRWTNTGWQAVIDLALSAGWEPTGTGPPRNTLKADWDGFYFGNHGQRVYARDAKNLADALERALMKTPVSERKELKDFIRFCRLGSFRLY
jgi:hypothetical protein